MSPDEEQLEAFLRQFRPRRPGPLPDDRIAPRRPRRIAAIAAIAPGLAAVTAGLLMQWNGPADDPRPETTMTVTPAAAARAVVTDWDPEALDRMLIELSARALPDVENRRGSVYTLAGN